MPVVKMNISLDAELASALRQRACDLGKPASGYLADLVREDIRRHLDELAVEGYRALSADMADFATAALPLAAETWPEWEDRGSEE